jgi:uridine kinase
VDNANSYIKVSLPWCDSERVKKGTSLHFLAGKYQDRYKSTIIAAKVNNDIKELCYPLNEDCTVEFIDLTDSDGIRIYQRSLVFVMLKACDELFPCRKVKIMHSLSKQGLYCEIEGRPPDDKGIMSIEKRMQEIAEMEIPFVKKVIPKEKAKQLFEKCGRLDRYRAIEHRIKPHVTIYECGGLEDYFYGYMAPHTGYVRKFKLLSYPPGFVLMHPQKDDPDRVPEFEDQPKLFSVFREYKQWSRILGVEDMGALNGMIKDGRAAELVKISEALHEKKIAYIADTISGCIPKKKLVLISGPSSSGKTTFAERLSIQLRVNGLKPVIISLDDYYKDKKDIPLDEEGKPDLEALDAIDVELFNKHLSILISGKEAQLPVYDFAAGGRKEKGKVLQIDDEGILIVEGIHGLNDRISGSVPDEKKYKIYISALTSLNIDDHNRVPSTDTRMIRRIVRDNQFRGTSALETLQMWPSVRRGERKYVFPFQESADIMFNSSLKYELGVLKLYAEPLLQGIDNSHPEYSEAKRLLELLSYFVPVVCGDTPPNSILREFIGKN